MPILCVLFPAPPEEWYAAVEALDAVSPLVEDAGPGTAYLEMHGIAGPPERWFRAVAAALPAAPPYRLGSGPNKFVARAAALAGGTSVADGEAAAFLAPLPVAVLGLEPEVEERLRLLGIAALGELAAVPHGPFVRRFGPEAARWHAWAGGRDDRPLIPRVAPLRIVRSIYGAGSAQAEEQVLFALRTLVAQVGDDVARAGKRCGRLILALECENGDACALAVTVAQPTAHVPTLFALLRARVEGTRLDAPVVGLRLTAERLEDGGVPLSLFAQRDPDPQELGVALARIEAALGAAPLRAQVVPGNRPESRGAYEPFPELRPRDSTAAAPSLATLTPLQYRLLEPREIDVVVDAHRPRFVGTPPQAVVHLGGPWRVDERWWDAPLRRDDYDVLLEDGSLYRIACCAERWYLYGVYD